MSNLKQLIKICPIGSLKCMRPGNFNEFSCLGKSLEIGELADRQAHIRTLMRRDLMGKSFLNLEQKEESIGPHSLPVHRPPPV